MVSTPAVVPQPQETEAIAGLVEKYLRPHQANDYRIIVRREAIRLGARRWLVEVDVEANGGEVRADDVEGRTKIYESMVKGTNTLEAGTPVSFDVLCNEIRGLGLNIQLEKKKGLGGDLQDEDMM